VELTNQGARLRSTQAYSSYSARVGVGRSQSNGMASRRRPAASPSVTNQVTPPRGSPSICAATSGCGRCG
jgi:hypothetical protein